MKEEKLNIFIIDEDKREARTLRRHLEKAFGDRVNVMLSGSRQALGKAKKDVHMVVMDSPPDMRGQITGSDIDLLQKIKSRYPGTEVITIASPAIVKEAICEMQPGPATSVDCTENYYEQLRIPDAQQKDYSGLLLLTVLTMLGIAIALVTQIIH